MRKGHIYNNALGYPLAYKIVAAAFALSSFQTCASTIMRATVNLNGTARGGQVSLMEVVPIYAGFVSVNSTNGESAQSVLERLADEIVRLNPFQWRSSPSVGRHWIKVGTNSITLPSLGLRYCFSGSDKGFAIPKPVLSVSGSYDAEKRQVSLIWINPPEAYDEILVGSISLPPNATSCVYTCNPPPGKHVSFGVVIGRRGDTFSPPASIVINTNSQEELDTFPFYMGLAPNWSSWSTSTNADAVICEQGIKPDVDFRVRGDPWDKPLFQLVKTTQPGVQGGVYRRFLGLKSGHTYKVEVRLNTLEMDTCTNEWELSFHAAYDNQDGTGLSIAQLAGKEPLPDGSSGPAAGRIALFRRGLTTQGKWVKCSTDKPGPGSEIGNITLPAGVNSITVWLRHCGANSTGVGMDWIRIEDVTQSTHK